jgi:geranylgeranyl pyrophosphate synthase
VRQLQAVIEATGARAEVEATIERLAATADAALCTLPVLPEARQALVELAAFVTGRDH